MNIKQALEYGIELLNKNNIESPNLKTRMLLANILNKNSISGVISFRYIFVP